MGLNKLTAVHAFKLVGSDFVFKTNITFLGYFDPVNIMFHNTK